MRIKIYKHIISGIALMMIVCGGAAAQSGGTVTVIGRVTDTAGEPVVAAIAQGTKGSSQALTSLSGDFILDIADGSPSFTVYKVGYRTVTLPAEEAVGLTVVLTEDVQERDEVINLGYTSQTRNSITGAVSTVSGRSLEKFPVANLSMAMTGTLSGLTSIERNSELSRATVLNIIRGISTVNGREPVVIIDGVICPNTNYEYITPQEIESIAILKDASATSIYGIQGANGMIAITTKRGLAGRPKVTAYFDQSFQEMTRRPSMVGSAQYAELRNEAGYNDGLGTYSQFSQNAIDMYRSGADRDPYPDNDYYGMFMKKFTSMQRAGLSVSGGNESIKYYSNLNFMHQGLPYKIEETEKYDPTPTNYWVNYRSNVDVKIARYLTGFMRLSGNIKREKTTGYGNSTIYSRLFNLPPTMYGPLTPYEVDPDDPTKMIGGEVVTHDQEDTPVYGMLNRSGYYKYLVTNIISQAGLTLDMSFLTEGLSLSGVVAYQTNSVSGTGTTQDFERWVRSSDTALEFSKKGSNNNTSLSYGKSNNFYYNINLLAKMDYSRRYGRHSIDAMGYVFYLQQDKEWWYDQSGMLPYQRQSLGVTALYGYDDRYYLKADLGYSGSDQFHKDHRFTATPAISGAWVISNEQFLRDSDWLTYLKLRVSYGVSANDQLGYDQRFLYLDDFRSSNAYDGLRGNPAITAEKMKKQNYGMDIGFFNSLTLSLDYYRERTDNMLISQTGYIPQYQGIPSAYYAKSNYGKMKSSGLELTATYLKQIGHDWTVYGQAIFSSSKNKVLDVYEAPNPDTYAYSYRTTGYAIGQQWGYQIDNSNGNGYFNSEQEIADRGLTYAFGTPRAGDFIYRDLNGDGIIDEKDQAPIGYSWFSRHFYSFSAGFSYRNFDVSVMFQGQGKVTEVVSGVGFYENSYEGVYNDIHLNAWTAERYAAGDKITFPALSLGQSTNHVANSYFIMDRSYLRLKNVEIGYTLPLKASSAIRAEKIRFTLRGQNLFTWDKMKTKYVDPDTGSLSLVQPYRGYNIGVSLVF